MIDIYKDAKIGKNTKIHNFVVIQNAEIGNDCKIQSFVFIPDGTRIGNRVFVGQGSMFTNDKHPKANTNEYEIEPVIVEDDVSIGAGSVILPGVRIGKGATVGAGSVVTKDVASGRVVFGNPAKTSKILDARSFEGTAVRTKILDALREIESPVTFEKLQSTLTSTPKLTCYHLKILEKERKIRIEPKEERLWGKREIHLIETR